MNATTEGTTTMNTTIKPSQVFYRVFPCDRPGKVALLRARVVSATDKVVTAVIPDSSGPEEAQWWFGTTRSAEASGYFRRSRFLGAFAETKEEAIARYVAGRRAEIERLQGEIDTARALLGDAK